MVEYEVTFKHRMNGETKTFKLGDSRTIANEKYKQIRKRFSWWWKSGDVYCALGKIY